MYNVKRELASYFYVKVLQAPIKIIVKASESLLLWLVTSMVGLAA